jgi:hypothetical protein
MNRRTLRLIIISCIVILSCDNPFLPATGVSQKDPNSVDMPNSRSTPRGVIDQLFHSYETKRLDLFTALLSKDYRFYIASGFDQTVNNFSTKYGGSLHSERPDSFMAYVNTSDLYYYWGYEAEIHSHSKLFSKAELITITSMPQIDQTHFIISASGDTTNVEVKVRNVTFEVSVLDASSIVSYPVSNQEQVFLLERDTDKMWVIQKWYDLGRE